MARTTKTLAAFPAADTSWRERSACRTADPDLFFPTGRDGDEPPYPLPEAVAICDRCPVKPECLAWALATNPLGTWGGTSEYQRNQLRKKAARVTCPSCGGREITTHSRFSACIACGASWFVY